MSIGFIPDLADPVPSDLIGARNRLDPVVVESLRGARLLITGGSGFLGSWLVDLALSTARNQCTDLKLTVLTRSRRRLAERRPDWSAAPEIEIVEGEIQTARFPRTDYTHIVHAAADTSVAAARRPLELADSIVAGSRHLLELAEQWKARRYLFLSSGAVAGAASEHAGSIAETACSAPPVDDPMAAYGNAKRYAEHLHMLFEGRSALEIVIARGFAFAGPRMPLDAHFAIGNFINDAVCGRAPGLKSSGAARRSYLYAADAAVWMLTMLATGRSGRIYNLGSDDAITVRALAERISTVLNVAAPSVPSDCSPDAGPRQGYVPDIGRARNELGLAPWTSLDDAIRRTALWASSKHGNLARQQDSTCRST